MFPVKVLLRGTELSILQQRAAFRQLGYDAVPATDTQISADDCLKLWVTMLIGRLNTLAPEQRTLLAEKVIPQLHDLGSEIVEHGHNLTPMIVLADTRYATWHAHKGWLDLRNGSVVDSPTHLPLETVAFNLAVLFHRNKMACDRIILETPDAALTN